MMSDQLRRIADAFWRTAADVLGEKSRDMTAAVEAVLPLTVVELDNVTPAGVGRWLWDRGVPNDLAGDAPLRGCLFARRGTGFVFARRDDDDTERRFTIAHEAAHFLLHYERVRCEGPKEVVEVLDSDRPATVSERMSGALVGRPVAAHVHLYGAADEGHAEDEADALAIEMLAPADRRRAFTDAESAADAFGVPVRVLERVMRRPHLDPVVTWAREVLTGRKA